ncbi:hypothetical protein M513_07402 [Trichuris suis]|uniref:Uncharacterized protein n=1 Tax=Trichuris suis TaxID=68888 RepID=A0A085M3B0_9BILA|nr:hypothetical protein M513_07402 [Trichuris suis]
MCFRHGLTRRMICANRDTWLTYRRRLSSPFLSTRLGCTAFSADSHCMQSMPMETKQSSKGNNRNALRKFRPVEILLC